VSEKGPFLFLAFYCHSTFTESNSSVGVETKYVEPPEGRKTAAKWRLYPFKGEESLDPIQISAKVCIISENLITFQFNQ
jgi:hypothetical protein